MHIALHCLTQVLTRSATLWKALNFPGPLLPYLGSDTIGQMLLRVLFLKVHHYHTFLRNSDAHVTVIVLRAL